VWWSPLPNNTASLLEKMLAIESAPRNPLVYQEKPHLCLSLGDIIYVGEYAKNCIVIRFTKIKDFPIELDNLKRPHSSVLINKVLSDDQISEMEMLPFSSLEKAKWEKTRKICSFTLCNRRNNSTETPLVSSYPFCSPN
jgi:hypothetical protein